MTDFARPLSLRSALGPWLYDHDDESCRLLTGVGRDTLERSRDGSVEPEPDVAERIWAVVQ